MASNVPARTGTGLREPAHRRNIAAMLNKVPEITLYFWIIKILATPSVRPPPISSTPISVSASRAPRLS
jgi:hypothetical protein